MARGSQTALCFVMGVWVSVHTKINSRRLTVEEIFALPRRRLAGRIICPMYNPILRTLKKNLNASRPFEHPPVREKDVKMFRWDHRLDKTS